MNCTCSAAIDAADNDPDQKPAGTEERDDAVKTMAWSPVALRATLWWYTHYNYTGICSHDYFYLAIDCSTDSAWLHEILIIAHAHNWCS